MEQKSVFVSVLAWIFIILSAIGILMLAMDAVVFWMLQFDKLLAQSAALNPNQPQLPTALMTSVFRWIIVVILLLQVWMLASSIGLLLRKNWARISFMVLIVIGLIWNAVYLLIGILGMVGIHFAGTMAAPPGMPPEFQAFMRVFMIFFVIFTIAMLVLFGCILKKLLSADIRREFVPPENSTATLRA